MKNQHQFPVETVELKNGRKAVMLIPENDDELAIVNLNVLKRLVALLPKANLSQIIQAFTDKVGDIQHIEQYVDLLKEELAFHESVNIIKEYIPQN